MHRRGEASGDECWVICKKKDSSKRKKRKVYKMVVGPCSDVMCGGSGNDEDVKIFMGSEQDG